MITNLVAISLVTFGTNTVQKPVVGKSMEFDRITYIRATNTLRTDWGDEEIKKIHVKIIQKTRQRVQLDGDHYFVIGPDEAMTIYPYEEETTNSVTKIDSGTDSVQKTETTRP